MGAEHPAVAQVGHNYHLPFNEFEPLENSHLHHSKREIVQKSQIAGRDAGTGANTEPLANPRRTPGGGGGSRTPGQQGRDARGTPRGGFGDKGTPRGTPRGGFGDATPLYDE